MDDELLAQPQVMKLLDSLREEYTKYQEVCRQRSRRSQLDQIHAKVMQVITCDYNDSHVVGTTRERKSAF